MKAEDSFAISHFSDDTNYVFIFDVNEYKTKISEYKAVLQPEEINRCNRFRLAIDRDNYIIKHGILRNILSNLLLIQPAELDIETDGQGKPAISARQNPNALHFSISSTKQFCAIAISTGNKIGIDIEWIDSTLEHQSIAEEFFHKQESDLLNTFQSDQIPSIFTQIWTAKEAYIKAHKIIPLADFSVSEFTPANNMIKKYGFVFERINLGDNIAATVVYANPNKKTTIFNSDNRQKCS